MSNAEPTDPTSELISLAADEGRSYACGSMVAVFKADGGETANSYSISEWTLDPGCAGVGSHTHAENDDTFYVLSGEPTFLIDGSETVVGPGAFIRVPPGVEHDFRNDTDEPARFLNIYVPGGFEEEMPGIVAWFAEHPA